MRFVLVGNYGVANLGDEALKEYFLTTFPEVEWIVLSANPQKGELPRLPMGIRSFFRTPWWRTVHAIRHADGVVFGGGTLFTDVESSLACVLWSLHARAAGFFGVPYYLAFQGVGPFRTRLGKRLTMSALRHAAFISVRDRESLQRVQEMDMSIKCIQTFDPIILSFQNRNVGCSKNMITVIPRHNSGSVFLRAFRQCLLDFPDADVCVLLMQPDDPKEQRVAAELQVVDAKRARIIAVRTLQELGGYVSGSACTLTERFHGALAALAIGVPVRIVSQAEGDKLSGLRPYAEDPSSVVTLRKQAQAGEIALRDALKI